MDLNDLPAHTLAQLARLASTAVTIVVQQKPAGAVTDRHMVDPNCLTITVQGGRRVPGIEHTDDCACGYTPGDLS